MPSIGLGVGVPSTNLGISVTVAKQMPSERQADQATSIAEVAERDRVNETSVRPSQTQLDRLLSEDALARFR